MFSTSPETWTDSSFAQTHTHTLSLYLSEFSPPRNRCRACLVSTSNRNECQSRSREFANYLLSNLNLYSNISFEWDFDRPPIRPRSSINPIPIESPIDHRSQCRNFYLFRSIRWPHTEISRLRSVPQRRRQL